MRCLGEISGRRYAECFVAHLLVNNVSTHIETSGDASLDRWEVWVRDEDRLAFAVDELKAFTANPDDPRYAGAIEQASQLIRAQEQKRLQAAKNIRTIEPVVRPNMLGSGRLPPLTLTLLILCIALGLLSNFGNPGPNNTIGITIFQQLSFIEPGLYDPAKGNAAASLLQGQVWRAVTPALLHGDIFHLAMNMFGLVIFGRILERLMGTPRFAAFVFVLALVPNLFQGLMPESLHGSPYFVGISGVIYGFLGYVWIRSSLNPGFGISVPFPFIVLAVGSIALGLSGAIPGWRLADLCHLGGLLVGLLVGYASEGGRR